MAGQKDAHQPIPRAAHALLHLTGRQAEVLRLAGRGLSGKQIAHQLGISVRTVEDHFSAMRQRTGAHSQGELIAYGATVGVVKPGVTVPGTVHMETCQRDGPGPGTGEEDQAPPPVHYSTGRLTRAQAEVVNTWRARLREDRPVPGREPVGAVLRVADLDDRPRASCSDAVAAAVADLFARRPPEPLALARYAYVGIQAQRAAAEGAGEDRAGLYSPVSYYLPAELAGPAEELRTLAFREARALYGELEAEAKRRHPGTGDAAAIACGLWLASALARQGLPCLRQIPRGAIARMAIDQWARRGDDQVAAAAVDYAASQHDQPHRARTDMHRIRR